MSEWYPKQTFGALVDRAAARYGAREALVFEHERYTFIEVRERVDEVARGLLALGVRPGDHVALWLMNSPEWIFTMFALARIGAVQIPINTRFRTHDLAYLLRQSDTRFLITHDVSGPVDYLAMVRDVVRLPAHGEIVHDPDYPELKRVVLLSEHNHGGCQRFETMLDEGRDVDPETLTARVDTVNPDHPVFIMYTSGTTGFPKGVVHNHSMLRLVEERAFRLGITENDTILNYLPLFHLFAYSEGALTSLITGARQVLTASFDADACIRLIEREGVTVMHGFDTHLKDLSEAQERIGASLSTLRCGLFAAGMQSSTAIVRRAAEVLAPLVTVTGYGMSEMGAATLIGAIDDSLERRAESSGYPAPGYEFRIVDPATGAEQPVGVSGEIAVRGYGLMMGYYKKPEETARSYDGQGWFRTGDCGVRRADGYIRFLGRYKDMLKVGGENVDPMEVEALLLMLDGVQQAAVVGFPDARLHEVAVAYVQRRAGAALEAQDVLDHCRGKVATFKIPRHVLFIDAMPMTASGKIRKVALREDAQRQLGAGRDEGGSTVAE